MINVRESSFVQSLRLRSLLCANRNANRECHFTNKIAHRYVVRHLDELLSLGSALSLTFPWLLPLANESAI